MRPIIVISFIVIFVTSGCLQHTYQSPIDRVVNTICVGQSFEQAEQAIKAYGGKESIGHQEIAYQVTEGKVELDRCVSLKWFDFKNGWTIQIRGRFIPCNSPIGEEEIVSSIYYMPTNESDMMHSFGEQRERYKIESLTLKQQ